MILPNAGDINPDFSPAFFKWLLSLIQPCSCRDFSNPVSGWECLSAAMIERSLVASVHHKSTSAHSRGNTITSTVKLVVQI
jgi:hypothetical protein